MPLYNGGKSRGGITVADSPDEIQWHPAFCGAAGFEFRENIDELSFMPEYNLSKEPIRIDLLILKDHAGSIKNELGHIMRKYNIIEYKSPDDGMSIDDFFKTLGYACLYKGYGNTVNAVREEELTFSLFRESYPREMFAELTRTGHGIEEKYPGIYYVTNNLPFPVQIVVTRELNPENHSSLRILSKKAKADDVRRFLEQAQKSQQPGERDNIDAVLHASVTANFELYEEVKRDSIMCEALRELMKDEIAEERNAAANNAETETQVKNIRNIMVRLKYTAEQAMDLLEIPQQKRSFYISKL
jgi:CRISPR/Cas system CSM-associated protein Csm2 small subunit